MNLPKLLVFHANCVAQDSQMNEALETLEKQYFVSHINPEELVSDKQWDEALAEILKADQVVTV